MIAIRKAEARGFADHGWLKTHHSFSFADYHDPEHMNFRALRVINEDFVAAAGGFPMHGHQDMEIITYVVSGALEHKDSHGNSSVIYPGEVQRMSAGTGVRHSEFNHSKEQEVHLLQIWIVPNQLKTNFSYAQKSFAKEIAEKKSVLVCSGAGRDGSISIQQDVDLYVSRLAAGTALLQELRSGRHGWLQVIQGKLSLNGQGIMAGDGAAISKESLLEIQAQSDAEILFFDLA